MSISNTHRRLGHKHTLRCTSYRWALMFHQPCCSILFPLLMGWGRTLLWLQFGRWWGLRRGRLGTGSFLLCTDTCHSGKRRSCCNEKRMSSCSDTCCWNHLDKSTFLTNLPVRQEPDQEFCIPRLTIQPGWKCSYRSLNILKHSNGCWESLQFCLLL